jgi:RNA polymerase sigma factor (sigma-70 family)
MPETNNTIAVTHRQRFISDLRDFSSGQRLVALFSSKERPVFRILQSFFRAWYTSNGKAVNGVTQFERLYDRSDAQRFGFTRSEFCEMLAEVTRQSQLSASELRLDELILARACARGNETAWQEFVQLYREKMYRSAATIARVDSVARELADALYADLFGTRIGKDGHRISKLASYLGRGSLEGWLRIVLAQEYVNRFRAERRFVGFSDSIDTPPHGENGAPESGKLAEATDVALTSLPSEERFLLAAYYLDGRSLLEIGRMLGVHESTISRRLEKITAAVRKKIIRTLGEAGFDRRAAEEMLEVDVRDLNLNIRERLTQERQGESI